MKKIMIIGIVFAILVSSLVSALGNSFETAEQITPGTYSESNIPSGASPVFYKINVDQGQRLVVDLAFTAKGTPSGDVYLYDESRSEIFNKFSEQVKVGYLFGSEKSSYVVYIKILGMDNWQYSNGYSMTVSLEDNYDADAQTDAGDVFDTALEISPGSYTSNWLNPDVSGYPPGNDKKDIFKVPVNKNDKVAVKLTPSSDLFARVSIYDLNRKLVAEKEAFNPGEIIDLNLVAVEGQEVYIEVSGDKRGSYSFNINLNSATSEEIDMQKKMNQYGITDPEQYAQVKDSLDQLDALQNEVGDSAKNMQDALDRINSEQYSDSSIQPAKGLLALISGGLIFLTIFGIVSTVLSIIALIHILSAQNDSTWKFMWVLVVVIGGIIGVAIYFLAGKKNRVGKGSSVSSSVQSSEQQFKEQQSVDPKLIQLKNYVDRARANGKSDDEIRSGLRQAGWSENLINQVL
jgi:hypothetical protein